MAINLSKVASLRSASNQLACGQGASVLTRLTNRKVLKLVAAGNEESRKPPIQ